MGGKQMKTKRILLTILSTVALVSCVDMLDLSPSNQIASAEMWTSETLADKGMAGLYENFYKDPADISRIQLRHNDMSGINRQGWMGMEFCTDYVCTGYPLRALSEATKVASDFLIWYEWKWAYTSIHQINDALTNLHKAGLKPDKYDRYICEAKFLRAWFYARLNKIYGGVPVYLEPVSEQECIKTQSTAEEVWGYIIEDLNDCINNENFPKNTLASNYGRPSKGAAYALRGQAYVYLEQWDKAISDFEAVADCGYGFMTLGASDDYCDIFHYKNEKSKEMIFTIQFNGETGYCDNLQLMLGGRDTWNSWANVRPSFEFVSYFKNADGTDFKWEDAIEGWNDEVFREDPSKREVFFLRNGLAELGNWDEDTEQPIIKAAKERVGSDVMERYYDDDGNEERVRAAYANREPRLKAIILTPYEPYDTFKDATDNGGKIQNGKQMRWPFLREGDDGGDYYGGEYNDKYIYKKYSYNAPDDLLDRLRCPTDWPLIRYTDVALMLAEAYVHEGSNLQGAIDIVNTIRTRAKFTAGLLSGGTPEEVLEAVKYERRVELCIEGHNYFDEWRWGTYKDMKFQNQDVNSGKNWWGATNSYSWYYTDDMYPWGAPSQECQRNPNLTKKPGWAY